LSGIRQTPLPLRPAEPATGTPVPIPGPADFLTDTAYTNATTDTATFGGTAGTVTLNAGATINAGGITFNTSGYRIVGSGASDVLNVAGPITVNNGGTDFIGAVVTGNTGFTIGGNGTLVLSGLNTYTGQTTIASGATAAAMVNSTAATNGAFGAGGAGNELIVSSGGTLNVGGSIISIAGGTKIVRIAGTGVGGIGAVVNSGGGQTQTFTNLTLTGDATVNTVGSSIGAVNNGFGRMDVRNSAFTAGAKNLDLGGFTLTKIGSSQFSLVNDDVTAGNIIINEGQLSIEANTQFASGSSITVNNGGRLGFFSLPATAVIPAITVTPGGSISDTASTSAAQTVPAAATINFNGSNGTFELFAASTAGTNFAGPISSTGTNQAVAKRGAGLTILSNQSNTFSGPLTIYQGNLQANFSTAIGGTTLTNFTGTPLGAASTITLSGGTLNVRFDGGNDTTTNSVGNLNRSIVLDRAAGGINLDRLTSTGGQNKNLFVGSITFTAPNAVNGYYLGQQQLSVAQTNGFRLQIGSATSGNDTVLNNGDINLTDASAGTTTSGGFNTNGYTLLHIGGNTMGVVGGTQAVGGVIQLGGSMRVGAGFGTALTNNSATFGSGTIMAGPNANISFRSPTNLASGQQVDLVSHQSSLAAAQVETTFTSLPSTFHITTNGVIGIASTSFTSVVDESRIGSGTSWVGSGFAGSANGTVNAAVLPGSGNAVRIGGTGTLTVTGTNSIGGASPTGPVSLIVGVEQRHRRGYSAHGERTVALGYRHARNQPSRQQRLRQHDHLQDQLRRPHAGQWDGQSVLRATRRNTTQHLCDVRREWFRSRHVHSNDWHRLSGRYVQHRPLRRHGPGLRGLCVGKHDPDTGRQSGHLRDEGRRRYRRHHHQHLRCK
jgi:autotransporter-associated beta strand protein